MDIIKSAMQELQNIRERALKIKITLGKVIQDKEKQYIEIFNKTVTATAYDDLPDVGVWSSSSSNSNTTTTGNGSSEDTAYSSSSTNLHNQVSDTDSLLTTVMRPLSLLIPDFVSPSVVVVPETPTCLPVTSPLKTTPKSSSPSSVPPNAPLRRHVRRMNSAP